MVALFILLMLSGSLGLLAGVFNDRIDGVKLIVLLLLLMILFYWARLHIRGTNAPENAPCLASNGWLSIHWFYCPTTSSDNQLLCGINLGFTYLLNKHREIKRVNALIRTCSMR